MSHIFVLHLTPFKVWTQTIIKETGGDYKSVNHFVTGNSRPKLNLTFTCCPWWFIFFQIFLTKSSVNTLWTKGLIKLEKPFHSFIGKNWHFISLLDAVFNFWKNPFIEKKYIYIVHTLLKLTCLTLFLKFIFWNVESTSEYYQKREGW